MATIECPHCGGAKDWHCKRCNGTGKLSFQSPLLPPPEAMHGFADQFPGTDYPLAGPVPTPVFEPHVVPLGSEPPRAPRDELQHVFDLWAQKLQRAQLAQSEATWLRTILAILITKAGGEVHIASQDITEFATSSRQIDIAPQGERLDQYDLVLRVRP